MENKNKVLLVMDMQKGIAGKIAGLDKLGAKVAKALDYARRQQIPVIYVVVAFREGMPEIGTRNKSFRASKQMLASVNLSEWSEILDTLTPMPGEVIVTKKRYSAFTGSDLEVVLRAYGAQELILTGVSTSGVVLSTMREAADKDYQLTILSDGCADSDPEVHSVLMNKVFPRQAEVQTLDEWIG